MLIKVRNQFTIAGTYKQSTKPRLSFVPLCSEKRAKYVWRHCFMVMWSFAFCTLFLVHVAHLLPRQWPLRKKQYNIAQSKKFFVLFLLFSLSFFYFFVFIYLFLCCLCSLSKPQIYLSTWQVSFFSGAITEKKTFFSAIMFTKKAPNRDYNLTLK